VSVELETIRVLGMLVRTVQLYMASAVDVATCWCLSWPCTASSLLWWTFKQHSTVSLARRRVDRCA